MVGTISHVLRGNGSHSRAALDKPATDEEKPEADDNARTIRPGRSPQGLGTVPLPVAKAPEPQIASIAEDYSDLLFEEEDEVKLEEKVADFKVCNWTLLTCLLIDGLGGIAQEFCSARTLPPERHQDVRPPAAFAGPYDGSAPGPHSQAFQALAEYPGVDAVERPRLCAGALAFVIIRG